MPAKRGRTERGDPPTWRRSGGTQHAVRGRIYRTWLDLKAKIAGTHTASVIDASEQGESIWKLKRLLSREAQENKELIWQDWQMASLLKSQLRGLTAAHEEMAAHRA